MESYLQITQINDFIFCPRSIFFHNVYRENYSAETYQATPQKIGLSAHRAIDEKRYSDRKNTLQGVTVYSEKYGLVGRIDLFNIDTGKLTERKFSISAVYDGFRYQLFAQAFALAEMGYNVTQLALYSSKDNITHPIPMPDANEIIKFENLILEIKNYTLDMPHHPSIKKCQNCIYRELCDISIGDEP